MLATGQAAGSIAHVLASSDCVCELLGKVAGTAACCGSGLAGISQRGPHTAVHGVGLGPSAASHGAIVQVRGPGTSAFRVNHE
jgi:hypothetical protein